ncbi:TDT family transporter [Alkaliphilus transvaalensis]|uniref:TDT family transporter n=1 Tax=Alkaliphilus transvaalensis TaxID=114628 RepID=UPI00047D9893|nr:TDT family transporter [Alkaliphilus transvaalensis]
MGQLIKKVPIPMAGLMLALAATGNLVLSYGEVYRNIFGSVSAFLLLLLVAKIITDPKGIVEGLQNPVVASVSPTFSMGVMILSTYLKPYYPVIAQGIWIFGLALHSLLIVYFTKKYILSFNIKKVFPSYFVVYVGIVVASVTAPVYGLAQLGQYIFWFGFISYLILLPIVLYRVIKVKEIPEPAMPTITIFAAPASLCLAGYMNSFQTKNMTIVGFLALVSLVSLVAVLIYMPKLLKLKFYPSYSAFTFPLVISGISIKLTNGFLNNSNQSISMLKYVVRVEEIIAVAIVVYVLIKYGLFLLAKEEAKAVVKPVR